MDQLQHALFNIHLIATRNIVYRSVSVTYILV